MHIDVGIVAITLVAYAQRHQCDCVRWRENRDYHTGGVVMSACIRHQCDVLDFHVNVHNHTGGVAVMETCIRHQCDYAH